MSSSSEERDSGSEDNDSQNSQSKQESSDSDNSNSQSGSNNDDSGSGSGSGSNSGSGSSSSEESEQQSSSQTSSQVSKKKKISKFVKDPFSNALDVLRDINFDLDSICTSISQISYKYQPPKPYVPPYQPPSPIQKKLPARNFYPPGMNAGETPKRKAQSKAYRQRKEIFIEEQNEKDSTDSQSDIAPTLSRNPTDTNMTPYVEGGNRYNLPPQSNNFMALPTYQPIPNQINALRQNQAIQQQNFTNVGSFIRSNQSNQAPRSYTDYFRTTQNNNTLPGNPYLASTYQSNYR